MDGRMEAVMRGLERNNIRPYFVKKREEVVPLAAGLLRAGETVSAGGSLSLKECGVLDLLSGGDYRCLDRYAPGLTDDEIKSVFVEAMGADTYFCSANAVTEAGELYNVDGNANRVSAIAHGPKSVIMVVGRNKLVPDLDAAVLRVKTLVAPRICQRRGRRTYCREAGRCVSLAEGRTDMTSGCDSPERVCCTYLVTGRQRVKDRIKVILVDEELGI